MPDIFFEDLVPGPATTLGSRIVTREEITGFAREYDPQPFHLGEESARETFVGRQIASGWHTIALQMRILCDAWLLRAVSMGSPGIDSVEWLKPVLPGDELTLRQTITDAKRSRSRPGMGIVQFRFEMLNGRGETVMRQANPILFETRDRPAEAVSPAAPAKSSTSKETDGLDGLRLRPGERPQMIRGFDEIEIGTTDLLGEHTFTADEIVHFAARFDPQPFHLSDEAARQSLFGRLAASGWQTGALWMRHLVRLRSDSVARARVEGIPVPRFGPSPGFTNLRWLKPVHAGDTIRYATTVVDKRPSASRPNWGLTFSHNTGWNQRGEKVFEFSGSGFIGRTGLSSADAA